MVLAKLTNEITARKIPTPMLIYGNCSKYGIGNFEKSIPILIPASIKTAYTAPTVIKKIPTQRPTSCILITQSLFGSLSVRNNHPIVITDSIIPTIDKHNENSFFMMIGVVTNHANIEVKSSNLENKTLFVRCLLYKIISLILFFSLSFLSSKSNFLIWHWS